jgi:peptidoglycan/LPS O-acetylase OafA/YrhL
MSTLPTEQFPAPAVSLKSRFLLLDGLRGIAALLVVLHHFSLSWYEKRLLFGMAPLAVDFFFCLSGFVIAHAYGARLRRGMPLRDYALRRLIRLYPMYVIGGLLGLAGVIALKANHLTDFSWAGIAQATVMHMLYIPNNSSAVEEIFTLHIRGTLFPLNNPAWSLFFELLCANIAYAFVVRASRWGGVVLATGSALLLVWATIRYGAHPGWGTENFLGGFPRVMFAFFAGVAIFDWRHVVARVPRLPAWLVVLAVLILFGVPRTTYFLSYWLVAVLMAVPILVAAGTQCVIYTAAGRALAEFAGRLSYPIYCIHYPLLMLDAASGWRPTDYGIAAALFVACSIASSYVLLIAIDEPARNWLNRVAGIGTSRAPD